MLKSCPKTPGANGITSRVSGIDAKTTIGARVKIGTSTPRGVKSSLARTLSPWTTDMKLPNGPTRSGPTRRFIAAMTLSSMKMITNAIGIVITMIAVAAATNRTRDRFAPRKSSTGGSSRAIPTVSTAPITRRAGTITRNALEPSERRFQYAAITGRSSLVHAAHHRVERRHDRHRFGDQVPRHQETDQPYRLRIHDPSFLHLQLVGPV